VGTPEKFKTHISAKGTKLSEEIYTRARTFLDSRIAEAWNEEEGE
jgi:hypothetical protein